VLTGDFHVHGFPGDGALPGWALRSEARRRGLDVIALTNHNQRLAGRISRSIDGDKATPLVLQAEEVTAARYHMTAIGIEDVVPGNLSASDAIAAVHAQGGVAVAAHPTKVFWPGWDDAAKVSLDGTEVAHPLVLGDPRGREELIEFFRSAQTFNPRIAPIGSTDYHFRQSVGLCRTYLFAREYSAAGVLDAIRTGRTVAVDPSGGAFGDPNLVAAVERIRAATPPPAVWRTILDRLSGLIAIAGILGLMICGSRVPDPASR
jgi:hypothetical protein